MVNDVKSCRKTDVLNMVAVVLRHSIYPCAQLATTKRERLGLGLGVQWMYGQFQNAWLGKDAREEADPVRGA